MPASDALDALRARARAAAAHSYVPYRGAAEGAAVLLADGAWVAGTRVENASFPLTIPALLAAYVGVRAAGRAGEARAVAVSHPFHAGEAEALAAALAGDLAPAGLALAPVGDDALAVVGDLPTLREALGPFLAERGPLSDAEGVALAHRVAAGAYAPESRFPVGCVLALRDGRLVGGVNVEHADWTRGLCAERAALAAALSAGVRAEDVARVYLACPLAPEGTPCGGCRQVLVELVPGVEVVMARGAAPPEVATPEALLPGAFAGRHVLA